jgi:hypothetical protein
VCSQNFNAASGDIGEASAIVVPFRSPRRTQKKTSY